jgi:hypothetical protein
VQETSAADLERVRALLGREPLGRFDVVVRDETGDPVVIRNEPLLEDGTPMPTRYWLIGPAAIRAVGRLESAGGVDRAERLLDPAAVAAAHDRYAAERDAALPAGHTGPVPSGGVGGTRVGVKCLHAHYAWHLAGGDDPVGAWVADELALAAAPRLTLHPDRLVVAHGDRWTSEAPLGLDLLVAEELGTDERRPPDPVGLSNAIGLVADHLADLALLHPELIEADPVVVDGAAARTLARVELGREVVPERHELDRGTAEDLFRTLATESPTDRRHNPGLPAEEVHAVLAAACTLVAAMRRLRLTTVVLDTVVGRG